MPGLAVIAAALLIPAVLSHRMEPQKPASSRRAKPAPHPSGVPATPAHKGEEILRVNNFGLAEMEQFRFTQAAEYFAKAQSLDRNFLTASVNLGIALFYDRKNLEAEKMLRGAIARNPRQPEALLVLALLMRASGKDEEALKFMKSVLGIGGAAAFQPGEDFILQDVKRWIVNHATRLTRIFHTPRA